MKKIILAVIVIILVIAGIIWVGNDTPSGTNDRDNDSRDEDRDDTPSVSVSETVKVSGQTSGYQNAELGFSIKYPTVWEQEDTAAGVSFIMPIDEKQVSTVAQLKGEVNVAPGKCAFPPVTTIKDRATVKLGTETFNTISMSNTVQGRVYFNRMYSLQKGSICYLFTFSSITLDPVAKGLTGSNITQAQNNNKAVVATADTDFTDMIKTFAFVTAASGIDETKAPKVQ